MTEPKKLTQEQQQELTQKVSIFREVVEKAHKDYLHYPQALKSCNEAENTKNKIKAIYYKGKLDGLKEFYCKLKKRCEIKR